MMTTEEMELAKVASWGLSSLCEFLDNGPCVFRTKLAWFLTDLQFAFVHQQCCFDLKKKSN